MKYRYLTIEREYGSGGTEIGRRLSEKLGIPCFGREILEEVSKERHISIESIEHCEETVTNSLFRIADVTGSFGKSGYAAGRRTYICGRAESDPQICSRTAGNICRTLCQ